MAAAHRATAVQTLFGSTAVRGVFLPLADAYLSVQMSEPPGTDWLTADSPQGQVLEAFLGELQGQWVWVYRSSGEMMGHSIAQYSALLTGERIAAGVSDPGWEVHIGAGGYGFTQYRTGDEWTTVYESYPGDGAELLVRVRDWYGIRPSEVEIVEEFRLLFNLWEDRASRTYYDFDGSGNPIKAAVITEEGVRVLSSVLRRYQAAKQMYLALYLDSTRWSEEPPADDHRWELVNDTTVLHYYRGDSTIGDRPFSRLFGKRLFAPPPIEASGIPPFEPEKRYEEFVIATTDTGEEVTFTSNPQQLANYFGANPDSPHYLTPVYFRREVLNKYYADPDRYTVEDGYLRCAGIWGLRMDNDRAGHVMAFLGDLGRDIPQEEARYWRSFNIPPPEEGPSETLIRRAFGGQFADPQSVDLLFPRAYREANEAWRDAFGEPLFKPLHADDRHVLSKLHVPVGDGAAEFDEQVLYLAKLLVDSLNEEGLSVRLGDRVKSEKGLSKLERFLKERGDSDARSLLKPFADVQGLRSRGAAHRKGSAFDITVAIGELGRQKGFEQLMRAATETLDALREFAAAHKESA
jgi:hypothetical protein